ncbi:MAG TPA: twin-arginine translocation signal domain-containing protein [Candidatus Dormibacteraeota bacterium]
MNDRHITRRQILKGAAAAGVVGALGAAAPAFAEGEDEGRRVRWDLINVATGCVSPGGQASARSNDGSKITVSGTGTFPFVRNKCRKDVTGGGTWMVTASDPRCFPGSGTFKVTELLSWTTAGGTPPLPCDNIGPHSSSGLATLRVAYSNGNSGTLTISCHFVGSPNCVFEGITATMDYEDFWNREAPVGMPGMPGFLEGNRTTFHILEHGED